MFNVYHRNCVRVNQIWKAKKIGVGAVQISMKPIVILEIACFIFGHGTSYVFSEIVEIIACVKYSYRCFGMWARVDYG